MFEIYNKIVLGTAQFGIKYGIANLIGKPTRKEIFGILDLAWEKGIRRFDTAPDYGSEAILGEFISTNSLQDEVIMLTKIPSLELAPEYQHCIRKSIESSLKYLGCSFEVLFFHNAADSGLILKDPQFFENLLNEFPISTIGASVYEPQKVESLSDCLFELAFQFPLNVLDRRFEQVSMTQSKRYARSVFLQGLLASPNGLRPGAPTELLNLQKEYHTRLAEHNLDPISFAVSYVANNNFVDYFLIGVDTEKQLQHILNLGIYERHGGAILNMLNESIDEKWLDPRTWN